MSDDEAALPSLEEAATTQTTLRVLVSAKEAGCLIGQNGAVIDSIRDETSTRAAISRLQPGSHERILTVSGSLDDTARALSYFAQALVNALNDTTFAYLYFPLKQLAPTPLVPGETTNLRLLIPNTQMGTLIGARGARIKHIQRTFHVLVVASNLFLPGSTERLVELQGSVDNLYDVLRIILRCLLDDTLAENTMLYVPGGRGSDGLARRAACETIAFPNDIVGALIGKNGLRILGVRKVSGAHIAISEPTQSNERLFTLLGSLRAVEKAKSLLFHNLEREELRRLRAEEPEEA